MKQVRRKQAAVEFMRRTAGGTLGQAATRLLLPGGTHHDWRFPAGWEFFIKAVEDAKNPHRRLEVKRLVCEGDVVVGHAHVIQGPGDPGHVVFFMFRFEGDRIAEMWAAGQPIQGESPNRDGAF